jgi:hypothetical protein
MLSSSRYQILDRYDKAGGYPSRHLGQVYSIYEQPLTPLKVTKIVYKSHEIATVSRFLTEYR